MGGSKAPEGVPGHSIASALWAAPRVDQTIAILDRNGRSTVRTHAELLERAAAWAAGLAARDVSVGARVGIIAHTSFDFIAACLATWRAGAAVVPLPPPARRASATSWHTMVVARLVRAGVAVVIADERDAQIDWPVPTVTPQALDSTKGSIEQLDNAPEDVAVIQFSSGSTADPKGVVLSHRSLLARMGRTRGFTPDDHLLRIMPVHFAGLGQAVIQPIALGHRLTLIEPQWFIQQPASWLIEIDGGLVTHTGGPNFAIALATREIRKGLPQEIDLSSVRSMSCGGGEAPNARTAFEFAEAAAPLGFDPATFGNVYALTETGVVSGKRSAPGLRVEHLDGAGLAEGRAVRVAEGSPTSTAMVASGPPSAGVEVKIVSNNGAELREREVGEINVRTPYLMDGYLDDPEATASVVVDGWFKTGDLGFLADGEIFVTGRSKDVIIVHGRNYHAGDIESRALAAMHDSELRCCAFGARVGMSEVLVLVLEAPARSDEEREQWRRKVAREIWSATGMSTKEIFLVPRGSLPLTDAGKLQRAKVREMYAAGSLRDLVAAGD